MIRNIVWLLQGGPFRTLKGEFSCGHVADLRGKIRSDDHDFSWEMHPTLAAISVCAPCAVEASILCCFCERRIYPGDSIALYGKRSDRINWEIATEVNSQVVGCLWSDCCPSGGFYAGTWTVDGIKPLMEKQGAAI